MVICSVCYPAFSVSMFTWSLPVAVPFVISRSAASSSHDAISGTSFGSVRITPDNLSKVNVLKLSHVLLSTY